MNNVMVVAPHPDDETIGCGGTILKHIAGGDKVYWLIVTAISTEAGFDTDFVSRREREIVEVAQAYGFASTYNLRYPTTRLDVLPNVELVTTMSEVFTDVKPSIVYLPYRGDIHTDHSLVFDAAAACTKWFRYESVKRILAYETLSETDFALNPDLRGFRPNFFADISPYLAEKCRIGSLYVGEFRDFPFPRSIQAVKALAALRGAAAGCRAAEAFMLLKEIW